MLIVVPGKSEFTYAFDQAALKPQKAAPQAKKKEILGEEMV